MPLKTDDHLLIWLPADCAGSLVSGMLSLLNGEGYDARVEIANYGRGQKMRINAQKRDPHWEADNAC